MPIPDSALVQAISDERDRQSIRATALQVRAAGGTKLASESSHAGLRTAAEPFASAARSRNNLLKKQGLYKRPTKAARRSKILRAQNEAHRRAAADLHAAEAAADKSTASKPTSADQAAATGTGANAPESNILDRVTYPGKVNVE